MPRSGIPSVLLAVALAGCAAPHPATAQAYGESHLLRMEHPWHAGPARVGRYVLGVPSILVLSPLNFVECLVTGRDPVHDPSGPLNHASAHLGGGGAWLLGGPFYLLGLPFESELGEPEREGEPPPAYDDGERER